MENTSADHIINNSSLDHVFPLLFVQYIRIHTQTHKYMIRLMYSLEQCVNLPYDSKGCWLIECVHVLMCFIKSCRNSWIFLIFWLSFQFCYPASVRWSNQSKIVYNFFLFIANYRKKYKIVSKILKYIYKKTIKY